MSEKQELKRIGAKEVANSGRSRGTAKGDGTLEPFLVDVKEYDQSFSVSRKVWGKLSSDAIKNGRRLPALFLCLGEQGKLPLRLFVVEESMFLEMHEAWREKYED